MVGSCQTRGGGGVGNKGGWKNGGICQTREGFKTWLLLFKQGEWDQNMVGICQKRGGDTKHGGILSNKGRVSKHGGILSNKGGVQNMVATFQTREGDQNMVGICQTRGGGGGGLKTCFYFILVDIAKYFQCR